MLKNKYGHKMVVADKEMLDSILDRVVSEVGSNYGDVFECVCDDICTNHYSDALKFNAMYKTNWLRKYVQTYVDIKSKE